MSDLDEFLPPDEGSYAGEGSLDSYLPDDQSFETTRPSWGWAAVKELKDMWLGLSHLAETGFMQPFRLLPDQDPGTMTRNIQDLARKRASQDAAALSEAPGQMIRSLGETFLGLVPGSDYSIYEKLKTAPVQTVSDLALPFSVASGLAGAGAKVAGVTGHGATAARLGRVAEQIAPTGLIKSGVGAVKELPGIGPTLKAGYFGELPREAQRFARREFMTAEKFTNEQITRLEELWGDVPVAERDLVLDAVEGTLDLNVRPPAPGTPGLARPGDVAKNVTTGVPTTGVTQLSPSTKAFMDQYRANNAISEMKIADVMSAGDPQVRQEILNRFENAHFKPLADKTSYQLGVRVTAPQAKRLWEEGLIGSHELPPTYFPHRSLKPRPEHADNFIKSIEPFWHGSLKARSGTPEFDREFLRAVTNHERSMNRYLANYNAVMATVQTQGVPLTGLRSLDDLEHALSQIDQASGVKHVYFSPELYKHTFNAQAKAGQKITTALAKDGQTMEEGLRRALTGAVEEFGDEYQAGLRAATQGSKLYAIPRASAKRLLEEMGGTPDGLKAFGVAHDIWRASVLALNPAWNTMNAVGNAMLATLSGSFNPKLRLKVRDYFLPDLQTSGMVSEAKLIEAMRTADKAKIRVAELPVGDWYNKIADSLPGATVARVTQFGYRLNEIVDNFFRESVAAGKAKNVAIRQLREEGHSGLRLDPKLIEDRVIDIVSNPQKAQGVVDFTNKFMGNYFDLTPWERRYVRNFAFPFWSWYKSMAKLNASLPVEYPGRTKVLQMLSAVLDDANDDPMTPEELKNKVKLGESSEGLAILASSRSMVPGIQAVEGLPGFSPVASLLYGTATGRTMLGQRLVPEGVEEISGRLFAVGEEGLPDELDRGAATVSNFQGALRELVRGLPQVRLTESLLKGETARPGDPFIGTGREVPTAPFSSRQTGWEALASTTGIQIKEYDEGLSTYRHRRRLAQAYLQGRKRAILKQAEKDVITDPKDELDALLERIK